MMHSDKENDIIPGYNEKKELSEKLISLCNDVLVLTQMINNVNNKDNKLLYDQYTKVVDNIQTIFKSINNQNGFRTKSHFF